MRVFPDKITKMEMKSAIARVRHFFAAATDRDFRRSALKEFDEARLLYRDHISETAESLRTFLLTDTIGNDTARADAIRLVALGEIVSALACLQCNGVERTRPTSSGTPYTGATWDDSDEIAQETIRLTVQKVMDELLEKHGAKVDSIYGDPRGHTVKLKLANGASNRGPGESLFGIG